ncbi:Cyclopropane-fatty-acyl-phospholipid synthase [Candidatus Ornithobacterium hominis]|uniref:Cyclopropane-fatty-acyl-phospholipid synthase n=1 Tax=Candidatus Ornithobacterium hominis TaxID=2497989 RepID=A0A383TV90_9FLAO|nr:class I SAM-dependent methyltransferase [Candidatus Ornithobacterium hominis]MCT7903924.1 class I SAM-dependent methyltransferase [Candidatus Ornithobacterium hominis]SZD71267.1 Cyclopropane-fatty-acyl-phospholipid synthase [Candidatus Ornithobacterium hominis]
MEHYLKLKDYFSSQESFEIVESELYFGLLETNPRMSNEELEKYYQGKYISHQNQKSNAFEKIYSIAQKYNQKQKLKILNKHAPRLNSVLDYGCGKGDFVHFLAENKINSYGFEPGKQAQENFLKKNKKNQLLDELTGKFDAITLFHVLEHIPNFEEIFEGLKNNLNPEGIMLLALPNYKSFDAQFYQNYWAAYDVPRHQWHFSPDAVENFAQQFGMIIVKRYPMLFDSFYVSLISEQYKKSSAWGKIRGLSVGFFSNIKALKTQNYSSILYVLKPNQ